MLKETHKNLYHHLISRSYRTKNKIIRLLFPNSGVDILILGFVWLFAHLLFFVASREEGFKFEAPASGAVLLLVVYGARLLSQNYNRKQWSQKVAEMELLPGIIQAIGPNMGQGHEIVFSCGEKGGFRFYGTGNIGRSQPGNKCLLLVEKDQVVGWLNLETNYFFYPYNYKGAYQLTSDLYNYIATQGVENIDKPTLVEQ